MQTRCISDRRVIPDAESIFAFKYLSLFSGSVDPRRSSDATDRSQARGSESA